MHARTTQVMQGAIAVKGVVPDAKQDAQPFGHFRRFTPEVLDQERIGLVHGITPFFLLEGVTSFFQFFRSDGFHIVIPT